MNRLLIRISPGELVDRLTILEIKSMKIKDEDKLILIINELKELFRLYKNLDNTRSAKLSELKKKLFTINLRLWNIENRIRKHEQKKEYDKEFIKLARSVYIYNDKRSILKIQINDLLGSEITDIKAYTEYNK